MKIKKSPLRQKAEKLENEFHEVIKVLEDESKDSAHSSAECRYKEIMAKALLLLLFRIDFIGTAVVFGLGMIIGNIISQAF